MSATDKLYLLSGAYVGWAKKLSSWRNGDAKLTSTNLVASDPLLQCGLKEPIGHGTQIIRSYVPDYYVKEYTIGSLMESYYFQTSRLLYPVLGRCTTTENSPAGYNTHVFQPRISQTPLNMGRHIERVHPTSAETERTDVLGMLLESYHLECTASQNSPAFQNVVWKCAFTKNAGTDAITQPTALSVEPFKWEHLSFPTFTYNSETLEVTIIGFSFDVISGVGWRGLDSSGYFSVGKMFEFGDISVTLMVIPYGKNAFELLRDPLPYVTDLALTWKFTRNSTNDYVQMVHSSMYCNPFNIVPGHQFGWKEGYLMQLHQLGSGTVVGTCVDNLNNDYYENP